ncbi:unnamed protein product [Blepharisma stoltei]|uniref:Uncharacterized protein n=1 Tax=Blepharisma stoltei TaxID=1481888 RepID=A0AAU9KCP5_9CILI|nr:unnamed protein product [Blepharisma stoltei]
MSRRTNSKDNELESLRIEKENLLRKNQFYISQVSQMEVKLSEMMALYQAKDSETEYYKEQFKIVESELKKCSHPNFKSLEELEAQVSFLKEENSRLKQQPTNFEDFTDLKIQFDHALRMKQIFEEKYREARSQLIRAEMKKSEEGSIFDSFLDESSDKTKLQDLEKKEKLQKLEAENKFLYEDNQNLRWKIKEGEEKIGKLNKELENALNELRELKTLKNEDSDEIIFKKKPKCIVENGYESDELWAGADFSNSKNQKIEKVHEEEDSTTPYRPFASIADRIMKSSKDSDLIEAEKIKEKTYGKPPKKNLEPIKTETYYHDIKPFIPSSDRVAKTGSILKSSSMQNFDTEKSYIKNSSRQIDSENVSFEKKSPDFVFGNENISQILKSQSILDNKAGFNLSFNEASSRGESFADEFPDEDELL